MAEVIRSINAANSEVLLRQFASEVQAAHPKDRISLKKKFKSKLSQHINKIQYHQYRQDRFILSQKRILEKQNHSIEKAKEFLDLRQQKAYSIKSHNLIERSKRAEEDLTKWESIVIKNKEKYEKEIDDAKIIIKNWNDKLSESCVRKSTRLDDLSKNLKEKLQKKERKIITLRLRLDEASFSNPQQHDGRTTKPNRHEIKQNSIQYRKQSRITTESMIQRRKKQEDQYIKQSIIKTVDKEQRINRARYIRHYLQENKKKQHQDKEEMLKLTRQNNLNSMKDTFEQRSQTLDKKNNLQGSKSKEKIALTAPRNRDTFSLKAVLNGETQYDARDAEEGGQASPNRNYDKLMTEKLIEISMLMRKNRNS